MLPTHAKLWVAVGLAACGLPCLAQGQATAIVLEDFEGAGGLTWAGLERHEAPGCEGRFAGMLIWAGDRAEAEATLPQPIDGNAWDRLELMVHAGAPPSTTLTVQLLSSGARDSGFSARLRVTWNGWNRLALHRTAFTPFGPAPQWEAITGVRVVAEAAGEAGVLGRVHVDIDRLALASGPAEGSVILRSFAGEPADWEGLEYDAASGRARWAVDRAGIVSTERVPRDWSGFEALALSAYCPRPTGAEFRIVLWSPNPDTPDREDNYSTALCANWQGWTEFTIRRSDFSVYGEPRGWDQIDRLSLVGNAPGWNLISRPDTVLEFGEMRLLPPASPGGLVLFGDVRYDAPRWPGAELSAPEEPSLPQPAVWRAGRNRLACYVLPSHDWTGMERLDLRLLAPRDVTLRVWLYSEDPATPGSDYLYAEKTLSGDAGHWQTVSFLALEFEPRGSPVGLQQIDGVAIKVANTIDPQTVLGVERIEVW
jgi:hypothetical protein